MRQWIATANAEVERHAPEPLDLPARVDPNRSPDSGPADVDTRHRRAQRGPPVLRFGPEPVAQLPLDDLAVVVGRQGVDEPVVLGPLEPGDVVEARPVEVLDRRRSGAVGGHHEGHHRLAPLRVGPADDGGGPDAGVAEQRLLDLPGVDVHPPADDQVLGPVPQREVPVGVEAADVAGVQPASPQRLGGGIGLLPVAGHDHVAPDHHLADLAGGEVAVGVVDDADLDVGAGDADALQAVPPPGMVPVGVVCLGQGGDRHRRLALPVDLGQAGAEDGEGVLQVGQVHRCAAIDDRLQVGEVGGGDGPVAGQPLHHGGSGEERHPRPAPQEGGDLVAVDAAGLRHDAHRPPGHVGQPVEPRTVRQRRGVEDAVLRHHRVDVGEVAERRHEQVAVRERGSLGPSGGAAGVEQPGRVLRLPADERRRRRRREPVPPLTGRHHRRLQRSDGADQRLDVAGMVGVGHDDGRLAVFEDVGDLVAVEAGVDRHGHETGVPDGEQRLEVLGPVAHHDGDPVTGRQAEVVAQASGRAGRPGGERAPAGVDALAVGQRRVVGPPAAVALHPDGQVHRTVPASKVKVTSWRRVCSTTARA